mmetsp:Transcript_33824/g.50722  ORF Transcript_33824/g.50722 Transcript_33824/m.50722 type:complete len:139 (+) Transcript_33824:1-417(+)
MGLILVMLIYVSITSFSSFTSQPPAFQFLIKYLHATCFCLWLKHTRTPLSIIDYLIRATAASRLFIQAIISPRSNHARNNDTVHAQSPTTIRLSLLFYAHTQFIMVSEAIRWVYTSLPNSLMRQFNLLEVMPQPPKIS